MRRIEKVIAHEDYLLEVHLNNRHIILCDMKERLKGIRFSPLKDKTLFNAFDLKGGSTISWSGICELTLDEILSMLDS